MKLANNNLVKIFFIAIFGLHLFIDSLFFFGDFDFIWIYGNSLKISEGYLPYRDFNLLSTPLFYWIIAFFCKLISYHIEVSLTIGALINTTIYYLCYRISLFILQNKGNALWVTVIIFCLTYKIIICFSYNSLVLLFILLIVLIEFKNITYPSIKNHLLIGLLLGSITLAKQSVGLSATLMSFTYLFFTFDSMKEKIRAIFWRSFMLFVVLFAFVIYLIITNSLAGFINYAVLGAGEFSKKNTKFFESGIIYFIPSIVSCILALIYMIKNRQNLYIKSLFFYCLSTQAICFPVFDATHVVVVNISFLLLNIFIIPFKKIAVNIKVMIIVLLILLGLLLKIDRFLTISQGWMIYPSSPDYFSGSIIRRDNYERLNEVSHYIQEKEKVGFKVIIVDIRGMMFYLAMGKINAPYDYLINGNLGVNGEQRIINEFNHQPVNTLYLVKNEFVYQDIEQVKLMIFKNYKLIDKVGWFLVYQQPSIKK